MKTYIAILSFALLFTVVNAEGVSLEPTSPKVFSSRSGTSLARISPLENEEFPNGIWKVTKIEVFKFSQSASAYERIAAFEIKGYPATVAVNDAGNRVIVLAPRSGVRLDEQVIQVFDKSGGLLRDWSLVDLYDRDAILDPQQRPHFYSVNGRIEWRGEVRWGAESDVLLIERPATHMTREPDGTITMKYSRDVDSLQLTLFPLSIVKRR